VPTNAALDKYVVIFTPERRFGQMIFEDIAGKKYF
jgi:hypothetical protein